MKSVKAAMEPCMMPMPSIAASDQHLPSTDLSQLKLTGVHCGKMSDASRKLVRLLKAMKVQRNTLQDVFLTLSDVSTRGMYGKTMSLGPTKV